MNAHAPIVRVYFSDNDWNPLDLPLIERFITKGMVYGDLCSIDDRVFVADRDVHRISATVNRSFTFSVGRSVSCYEHDLQDVILIKANVDIVRLMVIRIAVIIQQPPQPVPVAEVANHPLPLVGAPLVGAPPVGVPPVGVPLVGAPPVGVPLVGAPPVGAPPVGAPPVGAPLVGAPLVGAPLVGAPLVGAPPVGAPPVGAPPTTFVPTQHSIRVDVPLPRIFSSLISSVFLRGKRPLSPPLTTNAPNHSLNRAFSFGIGSVSVVSDRPLKRPMTEPLPSVSFLEDQLIKDQRELTAASNQLLNVKESLNRAKDSFLSASGKFEQLKMARPIKQRLLAHQSALNRAEVSYIRLNNLHNVAVLKATAAECHESYAMTKVSVSKQSLDAALCSVAANKLVIELEADMLAAETKVELCKSAIILSSKDLTTATTTRDEISSKLVSSRADIDKMNMELPSVSSSAKETSESLAKKKEELQSLRQEMAVVSNEFDSSSASLQDQQAQAAIRGRELDNMRVELAELNRHVFPLSRSCREARTLIVQQQLELNGAQTTVTDLISRIRESVESRRLASEQLQDDENVLGVLQQRIRDIEAASLLATADHRQKEIEEKTVNLRILRLEQVIQYAQGRILSEENRIRTLTADLKREQESVAVAQASLDDSKGRLSQLTSAHDLLTTEIARVGNDIRSLFELRSNALHAVRELEGEISSAETRWQQLHKELLIGNQRIASMEKLRTRQDAFIDQIQSSISEKVAEVDESNARLDTLRNDVISLLDRINKFSNLRQIAVNEKEEMSLKVEQLKKLTAEMLVDAELSIKASREKIENADKQANSVVTEFKKKLQSIQVLIDKADAVKGLTEALLRANSEALEKVGNQFVGGNAVAGLVGGNGLGGNGLGGNGGTSSTISNPPLLESKSSEAAKIDAVDVTTSLNRLIDERSCTPRNISSLKSLLRAVTGVAAARVAISFVRQRVLCSELCQFLDSTFAALRLNVPSEMSVAYQWLVIAICEDRVLTELFRNSVMEMQDRRQLESFLKEKPIIDFLTTSGNTRRIETDGNMLYCAFGYTHSKQLLSKPGVGSPLSRYESTVKEFGSLLLTPDTNILSSMTIKSAVLTKSPWKMNISNTAETALHSLLHSKEGVCGHVPFPVTKVEGRTICRETYRFSDSITSASGGVQAVIRLKTMCEQVVVCVAATQINDSNSSFIRLLAKENQPIVGTMDRFVKPPFPNNDPFKIVKLVEQSVKTLSVDFVIQVADEIKRMSNFLAQDCIDAEVPSMLARLALHPIVRVELSAIESVLAAITEIAVTAEGVEACIRGDVSFALMSLLKLFCTKMNSVLIKGLFLRLLTRISSKLSGIAALIDISAPAILSSLLRDIDVEKDSISGGSSAIWISNIICVLLRKSPSFISYFIDADAIQSLIFFAMDVRLNIKALNFALNALLVISSKKVGSKVVSSHAEQLLDLSGTISNQYKEETTFSSSFMLIAKVLQCISRNESGAVKCIQANAVESLTLLSQMAVVTDNSVVAIVVVDTLLNLASSHNDGADYCILADTKTWLQKLIRTTVGTDETELNSLVSHFIEVMDTYESIT